MLIAFEGLDQSGKETQARTCARASSRTAARCGPPSFPDYETPIGQRDPKGARRRARVPARRHAAALRRQPLRVQAAPRDRGSPPATSSSAIAIARRAWPTAKRRASTPRWLEDIQRHPARRRRDRAARHRARNRRQRARRPAAIATSATSDCSRACARATAARPRSRLGPSSTRSSPKDDVGAGGGAGRAATARATVSARTVLTPASPAAPRCTPPASRPSSSRRPSARRCDRGAAGPAADPAVRTSALKPKAPPHWVARRPAGRLACGGPCRVRRSTRQTGRPSCTARSSA